MQGKYGTYTLAANSAWTDLRREMVFNEADIPQLERVEVDVEGYLSGTGQADLTTKELAMRAALLVPFQDFALYRDDGGTSGIYLRHATSLSGVVVSRGPSFTNRQGAEYANQRKYTFTVRADYPIPGDGTLLMSFTERMLRSGGAPVYGYKPAINDDAQRQLLWFRLPYRLVQSGEAYGFLDWPVVPPPAFPASLMMAPEVEDIAPQRTGNSYKRFGRRWQYVMESNAPLIAVPNVWR